MAADTGFLVYNERTYPLFTRLLADLGVATHPSDMSFSLSDLRCGLEWRGTSLSTVFAQRRNAARPAFLAMLADVVRFNRLARRLLADPSAPSGTLADLLEGHRWSHGFLDWYLIPLGSAIWSADPETFTRIPARTFAEFSAATDSWVRATSRPGAPSRADRPGTSRRSWSRSATGAACTSDPGVTKVRRQPDGPELLLPEGPATFDHVVLATHSDQALELLSETRPTRSGRCSAPSATSPTRRRCTPTPRCCPRTDGPGLVELPAPRGSGASGPPSPTT